MKLDDTPFNYSESLSKASDRILSNLNIAAEAYSIRAAKDVMNFKHDALKLAIYKLIGEE